MIARIVIIFIIAILVSCNNKEGDYVCPPCGLECDLLTFSRPGICPHCNMKLILRSQLIAESNLEVNDIQLSEGSGKFLVEGGFDKFKQISVHYYKPKTFSKDGQVIFIIPGAGRNGRDYRDAWLEASEKYGLLVLSLEYSDEHYPEFWSYNLGGMIYNVDVKDETFLINKDQNQWIFSDFDRIFDLVKTELSLSRDEYDMFGHSAGAQIIHRLAIFKPESKSGRMIASNSGWYTMPKTEVSFPYGLDSILTMPSSETFCKSLVVFLGEEDNEHEVRGELRRSPEVDVQGLHRLARGRYFYNEAKDIANGLDLDFHWKLEIIPNVGHDYVHMSKAAARYLYERFD